ncbi:hypothetical protein [Thermococcus sp.]|uniref:hypothetical protein n=1 Tax=Thermococcus sp. TaxID=35749 RepID=UPI002634579B|nr:hypothetical protein [Thermococcus sp.]
MLISFHCESSSIEDCVEEINKRSENILRDIPGFVNSAKIHLSFGAFMNLGVVLAIDKSITANKVVRAEFSSGRNKDNAINKTLEKLNTLIPEKSKIVDFEVKTYTTPVTRRTYAVGVVVYNVFDQKKPIGEYTLKERRKLIAMVLEAFNYNPKVLNISELARIFGVSRDSIYYDIEQILKEAGKSK